MKILCRTALLSALATLALTGCDTDEKPTTAPAKANAAPEAAKVGAAGSGCELPVSFGIAAGWKPKQVEIDADDPLAALAKRGPFLMACEIDAKPAGNIGFLRVWTGAPGELKPGLQAFIGDDAQQPAFTEIQVGGKPALAVDYQSKSQLDEGTLEKESAFAVASGKGLVVVSLDSFDDDEHAAMLPTYQLAQNTLTVS